MSPNNSTSSSLRGASWSLRAPPRSAWYTSASLRRRLSPRKSVCFLSRHQRAERWRGVNREELWSLSGEVLYYNWKVPEGERHDSAVQRNKEALTAEMKMWEGYLQVRLGATVTMTTNSAFLKVLNFTGISTLKQLITNDCVTVVVLWRLFVCGHFLSIPAGLFEVGMFVVLQLPNQFSQIRWIFKLQSFACVCVFIQNALCKDSWEMFPTSM